MHPISSALAAIAVNTAAAEIRARRIPVDPAELDRFIHRELAYRRHGHPWIFTQAGALLDRALGWWYEGAAFRKNVAPAAPLPRTRRQPDRRAEWQVSAIPAAGPTD